MATSGYTYDASWASTSLAATAILNGAGNETGAISNSGKVNTEVGVDVGLDSGTVSGDVVISILRKVNDSEYETTSDGPFSVTLPNPVQSTTRFVPIDVPARVSDFKVRVDNGSGVAITVTVMVRQAVVTTS